MTDLLLSLIADYGLYIVFGVVMLSCFAVPTPSSPVMLVAGGFAAAGDLVLWAVGGAALAGAILGDNASYAIARFAGTGLADWIHKRQGMSKLFTRAEAFMAKWGASAVFFYCWLVGPLGPYMNYVAGLTRFNWATFAMMGALGEAVWVSIYVGLGYSFANQIDTITTFLSNASGFIVAGVAVIGLGIWAWKASHPAKEPA